MLLAHPSLEELLNGFADLSAGFFDADVTVVFLFDPLREILTPKILRGIHGETKTTRIHLGDGMVGWTAREKAPLVLNEIGLDPRFNPPFNLTKIKSAICFPILFSRSLIGVVFSARYSLTSFSETSVKQMQEKILEIAPILDDCLGHVQTQEKLNELSSIMRITALVNSHPADVSLNAFIEQLSRELEKIFHCEKVQIWLMSDKKKESFCQLISEKGELKGCLALEEKVPMIENHLPNSDPWKYIKKRSGSVCCIPLVGHQTMGMVLAESKNSYAFQEEKIEFYMTIANQIAMAIERIQNMDISNARIKELSTLYEVAAYELSAVLSSTSNLDQALELTTEIVARLLKVDRVSIFLLNEEKKELYLKTSRGPGSFSLKKMRVGEGIAGWVMKTGKPYTTSDKSQDPKWLPPPDPLERVESLLSVPLMVEGRRIGIINAGMISKKRDFSDDDIKTLMLIASRAALVIENALLHDRERKSNQILLKQNKTLEDQSRELEKKHNLLEKSKKKLETAYQELEKQSHRMKFLYEFSLSLSKSLDLEEILRTSLDKIEEILTIPISSIAIHQIEGERERKVKLMAARGLSAETQQRYEIPLLTKEKARFQTLLDKKPILFHNLEEHRDLKKLLGNEISSLYCFPLVSKENVRGILTLTSSVTNALGDSEQDLLMNISNQLALAFENARLYKESSEYSLELGNLNAVVTEIASIMNFKERVDHLVKVSAELLGHEFCLLALLNETGKFSLTASYGFPKAAHGEVLHFKKEVVKNLKEGKIQPFSSIEKLEEEIVPWMNEGSIVFVPLQLKERVFGLLALGRQSSASYTSGEIDFIRLFAHHVAVAVENARLYDEALLEKNKMEAIVNQMGDGVVILDALGKIILVNEAAENLTGLNADEVIGISCEEAYQNIAGTFKIFLPETPKKEIEEIFKEEGIIAREGDETHLRSVYSFVKSFDGKPLGWVILLHDISEEKKQEQSKNDFLSIVSHDLRTPLTAIKGYAATLLRFEERLTPELRRDSLNAINSEMDRFARLLDNLLDLSRIESGRLSIHMMPFNLKEMASRVVEMFKVSAQNHKFALNFPESYPEAYGDPDQVEQVLNNLMSNAVKYSPTGGIIEISGSEKKERLYLSVKDQGMGIPQDQLEKIFERYHRVDSKAARLVSGTGLGLYISKKLIEAQGGKIWVESQVGSGSTFYLTLPKGESKENEQTRVNAQKNR
jgi:PAS domain S-box-containing protein